VWPGPAGTQAAGAGRTGAGTTQPARVIGYVVSAMGGPGSAFTAPGEYSNIPGQSRRSLHVNASAGKAIVIIDDEKSYLDLLAELIREHFANPIITFTRPLEALQALPNLNVGIVVTDYYMPQLTGLELIVRARALKPGVPFIIITGHGVHFSEEDFSHLPELRAVMHKPLGWRQLSDAIATHWPAVSRPEKAEAQSDVFLP
jgi:CheY-like chemotaxis protein